jgi:hypothetical protein
MKKILGLVVLFLIISSSLNVQAGRTKLKRNNFYEKEIFWTSSIKFKLPPGQWRLIDKWGWEWSSISGRGASFILDDGKRASAFFEISEINTGGKYVGRLVTWLQKIFFRNEHDGCYERPEYYLLIRKKEGAFFNCFKTRHFDLKKRLYNSDDQWQKVGIAKIRKYLETNNISYPRIMLLRNHDFFAMRVDDSYIGMSFLIDPEIIGGPKSNYAKEETSEYHKDNINEFPDHKKFMNNFTKNAAIEHKIFEKNLGAKREHLLDFSQIGVNQIKKIETINTDVSSDIISELKILNELYKSGALSKEEFIKAKKKILN